MNNERLDIYGIFNSHSTVIKDAAFNKIFQDPNGMKNERNVEVNALRADWILKSDDGLAFL